MDIIFLCQYITHVFTAANATCPTRAQALWQLVDSDVGAREGNRRVTWLVTIVTRAIVGGAVKVRRGLYVMDVEMVVL